MKAILKNIRISPRKMKLAADLIRSKNSDKALSILEFANKKSARILSKLLNSAIANAVFQGETKENLKVEKVLLGPGKYFKRFLPRARGSASSIIKRTTNISVFLKKQGEN
jgi:large subunit ribosomal protein L22